MAMRESMEKVRTLRAEINPAKKLLPIKNTTGVETIREITPT